MRRLARSKPIAFAFGTLAMFALETAMQATRGTAVAQDVTTMPQPVERASAEDCAIIVEVGKHKMNWGATPPDSAFFPEFDRDGGGTYLEDCPWRQLGVAEPLIKAQNPEKGFFITRPHYAGTTATVDFQCFIAGPIVDGKRRPPFIRLETCSLEKRDDRWQLRECKLKAVT